MLAVSTSIFSTCNWVAIPAWSCPGCQSVSNPRIRCQRIRMSCSVLLNAWPTCSAPVTLGGGIMIVKVSLRRLPAPARNAPELSQAAYIRASASAALKVFSIGIFASRVLVAGRVARRAYKGKTRKRG